MSTIDISPEAVAALVAALRDYRSRHPEFHCDFVTATLEALASESDRKSAIMEQDRIALNALTTERDELRAMLASAERREQDQIILRQANIAALTAAQARVQGLEDKIEDLLNTNAEVAEKGMQAMLREARLREALEALSERDTPRAWRLFAAGNPSEALNARIEFAHAAIAASPVQANDSASVMRETLNDIANSCSINGFPEDAADTLQWIEKQARAALKAVTSDKSDSSP